MEIYEAAELVEAIAKSIAENPSQFHFEINVTGARVTAIWQWNWPFCSSHRRWTWLKDGWFSIKHKRGKCRSSSESC